MAYVGKEWKLLSETAKAEYDKMAVADKVRYEKEKMQMSTHGYFVNSSGVNS